MLIDSVISLLIYCYFFEIVSVIIVIIYMIDML